jgi:hypothetical protein
VDSGFAWIRDPKSIRVDSGYWYPESTHHMRRASILDIAGKFNWRTKLYPVTCVKRY